ncbi:MAG: protein TolQ [Moraxellaceae bacterium]|nr:protein TolQ [Pseudomonadales bacterium]MCB1673181.1 protein TolQ [Pseudomonadales bacterium]MCP5174426.1 protein TolQ [Moraxellaceae bacterium]MCP5177914.1 protein TolQ [Moraxellaceae bacterium]HQV21494.1 protein TolQ [Agitococcus sp.]
MTEQLSIIGLVTHASVPVQLVMLALVAASVYSWSLIIKYRKVHRCAAQALKQFEAEFWSGIGLNALYQKSQQNQESIQGTEALFHTGFKEFMRLKQKGLNQESIMQGVTRAMRITLSQEQNRLEGKLPALASIASTAPYVGLFGTVWGIMTSFIGLAQVQQATLATVAPGIAEALIATAIGLFAAIPAVLAYNHFMANSDILNNRYTMFADEFMGILHRES